VNPNVVLGKKIQIIDKKKKKKEGRALHNLAWLSLVFFFLYIFELIQISESLTCGVEVALNTKQDNKNNN